MATKNLADVKAQLEDIDVNKICRVGNVLKKKKSSEDLAHHLPKRLMVVPIYPLFEFIDVWAVFPIEENELLDLDIKNCMTGRTLRKHYEIEQHYDINPTIPEGFNKDYLEIPDDGAPIIYNDSGSVQHL